MLHGFGVWKTSFVYRLPSDRCAPVSLPSPGIFQLKNAKLSFFLRIRDGIEPLSSTCAERLSISNPTWSLTGRFDLGRNRLMFDPHVVSICQFEQSPKPLWHIPNYWRFYRTRKIGFQCPVTKTYETNYCVLPDQYVCDGDSDCDFGIDECFCDFSSGESKGRYINDCKWLCLSYNAALYSSLKETFAAPVNLIISRSDCWR